MQFFLKEILPVVWWIRVKIALSQSQKTEGFCVANFVTLSDERRSRSKTVLLFNTEKRTLRSKI